MIKVHRITPQGYCNGVQHALKIVRQTLDNPNTVKPIYLLGQIIHNRYVVDELKEKGIIVLEDNTKTRLELLRTISKGSVIFSAHGVSPEVYQLAKEKKLNIIDSTCPNVLIVHNRIQSYLDKGYECIYIGTKNHPECEGVLGISKQIHFISSLSDIEQIHFTHDKIYATNQTTLSMYDIAKYFQRLKEKFPTIVIDDKICNATTIRQEAMAKQEKVDLCIVVGDSSSSNTKKLVQVSQNIAKIPTILCESVASLKPEFFEGVQSVSISSGASTPSRLVDEIIEYIHKL